MKRLLILLPLLLGANEDFISHYEYGEMLLNNPRGVSCAQCHGKSAEGKIIVSYRDEDGKKVIKGPDIRSVPLSKMIQSLNDYHAIMPCDLPFVLYMAIDCELTKDDVWVLTTDNMDGAEYETTLNDKSIDDLKTWSRKVVA